MVKEIYLTNSDEIVYVDDIDYEYLNQWNWQLNDNPNGKSISRCQHIGGKHYAIVMAREIAERMRLDIEGKEVDHIDRNPVNNQRRNNLRPATRSQNTMNQGLRSSNTSGYKGVNWNKASRKYIARIFINGERIYLGLFDNPIEAAYTYDHYAKIHFGEFAVLNFPEDK